LAEERGTLIIWYLPETAPKNGSTFLATIQRVECGWRPFLYTTLWQKKPRRFCGVEPNYRLITRAPLMQPALVGKTEAATRVANGWSVKNDLVPSHD
jgi:hypothetical protein